MQSFRVEAVPVGSVCRLILTGELDIAAAPDITELGCVALSDPIIQTLVVDLAAVTFVDSTATGALIRLRNIAAENGRAVVLTHLSERVEKVLTISGLTEVFEVLDEG